MTKIEQQAMELLNGPESPYYYNEDDHPVTVLARAIEQHEQFKREVSQMADAICVNFLLDRQVRELLTPFILPKTDHIRGAALDIGVEWGPNDSESFRAALAKRGGRIVWEGE